MTGQRLTVHDIGPDGDSTYDLIVGRDIDADVADEVIRKSGGSAEVYAMHHYEAGERIESFVSKAMYDRLKGAMGNIDSHTRSIVEIKADLEVKGRAPDPRTRRTKPWWAFWR